MISIMLHIIMVLIIIIMLPFAALVVREFITTMREPSEKGKE